MLVLSKEVKMYSFLIDNVPLMLKFAFIVSANFLKHLHNSLYCNSSPLVCACALTNLLTYQFITKVESAVDEKKTETDEDLDAMSCFLVCK
jgi:hypothetical protein